MNLGVALGECSITAIKSRNQSKKSSRLLPVTPEGTEIGNPLALTGEKAPRWKSNSKAPLLRYHQSFVLNRYSIS